MLTETMIKDSFCLLYHLCELFWFLLNLRFICIGNFAHVSDNTGHYNNTYKDCCHNITYNIVKCDITLMFLFTVRSKII